MISILQNIGEEFENKDDFAPQINVSLQWVADIIPSSSALVFAQCLKAMALLASSFRKEFNERFADNLQKLCQDLTDARYTERNVELLVEAIVVFKKSFHANIDFTKSFTKNLLNMDVNEITESEVHKRLKIVIMVMKISENKEIVMECSEKIRTIFESCFTTENFKFSLMECFCQISLEVIKLVRTNYGETEIIEKFYEILVNSSSYLMNSQKGKTLVLNYLSKTLRNLPPQATVIPNVISMVFDKSTGFFAENSQNHFLVLIGKKHTYTKLCDVISTLLTPNCLKQLQLAYASLRETILEKTNILRECPSEQTRNYEAALMILLQSLQSISCVKSSIIVMMGLRPGIFEFLVDEMPLNEQWFATEHPTLYYLFIHILIDHLKAHEYYIAQSDYIVNDESLSVGQTKREYAKKQIKAINAILQFDGEKVSKQAKTAISAWIFALVQGICTNINGEALVKEEWTRLHSNLTVQSTLEWNIEEQSVSGPFKMAQESVQTAVCSTTFGAEEFGFVTNFLLNGVIPPTFSKGKYLWMDEFLRMMTYGVTNTDDKKKVDIPEELIAKWRWVLAQTANFCIVNKMKTPLGKPMETFSAFSTEINKLAKEVLTASRVKEKSGLENPPLYPLSFLRVRLLLEFIDVLEKLMANTMSNGATFSLMEIPGVARQFFITNASSCNEWLLRTYYPAMVVAFFNGHLALTIRFGWNALVVYQKRAKDEKIRSVAATICCWMARAMATLTAPQAIVGIRKWVKMEFETDLGQNIMEALEKMACDKYEESLTMFEACLLSDNPSETLKLIIHNAMLDVLNRLRLPHALSYYRNVIFVDDEPVSEDYRSVELLTKFEKVEHKLKRTLVDWNIRHRLTALESSFSQTMRMVEIAEHRKEMTVLGALALSVDPTCKIYSDISSTNLVVAFLVDNVNSVQGKNDLTTRPLFTGCGDEEIGEKLTLCRKVMHWAHHLKHIRRTSGEAHLEIVRLARKCENRQLASWHVKSSGDNLSPLLNLQIRRQSMKLSTSKDLDMQVVEMNKMTRALCEVFGATAKWKQERLIATPNQAVAPAIFEEWRARDEAMARSCLQLANVFEKSPERIAYLMPDVIASFFWSELYRRPEVGTPNGHGIVGALLSLSARIYPQLAKTHLKLAEWASALATPEKFEDFNPACKEIKICDDPVLNEKLWKCMKSTTNVASLKHNVMKLLNHSQFAHELFIPGSYFLNMYSAIIEHQRQFLVMATTGYFSFLRYSAGPHPYSKKEQITVASLHIIDILTKFEDFMVDLMADGLSSTNCLVWKDILPQLFARLSHRSEIVRSVMMGLINKIGVAAPHSVVFQIVSGAAAAQLGNEKDHECRPFTNDERARFRSCCEILEQQLEEVYPELVRDTKKFVNEIERINLLPEEKWAVVLGSLEHEMEKRLAQVRNENARTSASAMYNKEAMKSIMAKKTNLITCQIFEALDTLYQQTCEKPAETEHEKVFQSSFGEKLKAAAEESKLYREQPEKAWAPFKNLISVMVHRHMKRGAQQIETKNISPYLATISKTCVPMPGQDSVEFENVVHVHKIHPNIVILPTKTRPKKLTFIGSDGISYVFLFKGREDLHLDERVTQFLRMCNTMLTNGKVEKSVFEYEAHNYAVIPLGPRSGLIKWVEGATPMFQLFRKWQARDKLVQQQAGKKTTNFEIERPSEMFNKTVRNVFAELGIGAEILSDRTKWPPEAMEKVFETLVEKTPKDLLSREFWVRSGCATTWWRVTTRFSRSCAVMSMIGAMLGLGDRHLDNLLVNLNHGYVVHIDYNICFDKGRNLRIPETVPFRLTQNMVNALGPSFIQGTFRESCIHVLSTLRAGKTALRMLLDAFVYDPLVDWTNSEHGPSVGISYALQLAVYGSDRNHGRKDVEYAKAMFEVKMGEFKGMWLKNRQESYIYFIVEIIIHNCREDLESSIRDLMFVLKAQRSFGVNEEIDKKRVEAGRRLQAAVTRHHWMMKELRPLLRSISRSYEGFERFYENYKTVFSGPLVSAHEELSDEKNMDIDGCLKHFQTVLESLEMVFTQMVNLAEYPPLNGVAPVAPFGNYREVNDNENVYHMENPMARTIIEGVEKRLNGAVGETIISPEEQADSLIEEAVSKSNLSRMYEGWTAWV
ncbi:unnamed protein product [Caenorhabditis bovis]|uniref:non-specific serine/threonine protein kinase n=1 Tax=Caenorhabditis bovis TaxID=2654633 RepID=A0A8S1F2Q8_9PELO|nr:unnamed protein product [Caenorhabditis bovis]